MGLAEVQLADPITSLDAELGYPCYVPSDDAVLTFVARDTRAYVSLATTAGEYHRLCVSMREQSAESFNIQSSTYFGHINGRLALQRPEQWSGEGTTSRRWLVLPPFDRFVAVGLQVERRDLMVRLGMRVVAAILSAPSVMPVSPVYFFSFDFYLPELYERRPIHGMEVLSPCKLASLNRPFDQPLTTFP
jgi:hypothetical protein